MKDVSIFPGRGSLSFRLRIELYPVRLLEPEHPQRGRRQTDILICDKEQRQNGWRRSTPTRCPLPPIQTKDASETVEKFQKSFSEKRRQIECIHRGGYRRFAYMRRKCKEICNSFRRIYLYGRDVIRRYPAGKEIYVIASHKNDFPLLFYRDVRLNLSPSKEGGKS